MSTFFANALVFTLAIDHSPPYSMIRDTDTPQGLSIDVVNAVLAQLNATVDIVDCPWARCMVLAKSGEADLIAGGFKTPEREKDFAYIEPAFIKTNSHFGFYVLKSHSVDIRQYEDLKGLSIGIQRGANYFSQFDHDATLNKIAFNNIATMVEMLLKGRIDAFIHVSDTVGPILEAHHTDGNIIAAPYQRIELTDSGKGYLMLSKQSKHIDKLPLLNKAMAALAKQGKLTEISNHYLIPATHN